MKVIVIGATGTIGSLTVQHMLADGHAVTAFSRTPERIGIDHPELSLVSGDVLNQSEVDTAVAGHDAVVITLGSKSLRSLIRSKGTLIVIHAMQKAGMSRLICQSTLGAHESWSNLNFFWKRIMFGGILRIVFRDHELQELLVEASGLDWTIVRPSGFTDRTETEVFKEAFAPTLKGLRLKIARSDVASFLTKQLTDRTYHQRAVAIST
ncbi:NAD(P)-binding oxidoreductase [uncultured Sulfitobacter sp.]|uniref:NAD(P)-dependent oxidoreductase n=1 Tax=uncultured Sulfitobacter sp. TaxID=191468 RepID=UPI00260B68E6|nr:NAD(P)-binding oxidoreductase [uncultured Sulfitobacter sp.]